MLLYSFLLQTHLGHRCQVHRHGERRLCILSGLGLSDGKSCGHTGLRFDIQFGNPRIWRHRSERIETERLQYSSD